MNKEPIYVTKPFLPELDLFIPYLREIWDSGMITNGGKMHQHLESRLCQYLGVSDISLFNNGTTALLVALKALGVKGEVITTPFSFVATSHSILWNELTPVFVDIDPETLNIDVQGIEQAISSKTSAIMPVHCYGNPCDVEEIKKIAKKHNLKVIYDAAHAFGVEDKNGSILNYGDLSILSFHATKVFNTFEGGAIVSSSMEEKTHIDQLKNFGFVDEVTVVETGINGKLSEINAAFGLLQLDYIDELLKQRKEIDCFYREEIEKIEGVIVVKRNAQTRSNYLYFPILIKENFRMKRDELYSLFKEHNIFPRRYFYPLISDFPMYSTLESASEKNLPVANKIKNQILCLPIYPGLSLEDQKKIIKIIKG